MSALPPLNANITIENNSSDDEGCCGCFGKKKNKNVEEVQAKSFSEVVVHKPDPIKRQQHYRDLTKYPSGEMTKSKINIRDIQEIISEELMNSESKDNSKK